MIRKKSPIAKSSYGGFTLMETSIVIVVASLLLSSAVPLIKTWMDKATLVANQQRLTAIQQALTTYEKKFNKLPCPAPYTAGSGSPSYGRGGADPCTAAPAGGALVSGRPGVIGPFSTSTSTTGKILIGALPTRDLGLPDADIANTYGYRYTYAVTQSETTTITTPAPKFPPNPPFLNPYGGAIEVNDQAGNDVTPVAADGSKGTALYVVVDHGADGKGAYTIDGAAPTIACAAGSGLDYDNCNNYASQFFRNAPFSKNKIAGKWFDDTVIFDTGANTKVCTTAFANSPAGVSGGYVWFGFDMGFPLGGAGFNIFLIFFEIFGFWFDNVFVIAPVGFVNPASPTIDAYCADASFHVVTGGCSDTFGGPLDSTGAPIAFNANGTPVTTPVKGPLFNVFGGDIASSNFQKVLPPLGHPVQNAAGFQGWECNGSSASGMQTQVYAVCCNK